jgi:hypothetical protein
MARFILLIRYRWCQNRRGDLILGKSDAAEEGAVGRNAETNPKDAGLLVTLLLVILGTLIMAWVADQKPAPEAPGVAVEREPLHLK